MTLNSQLLEAVNAGILAIFSGMAFLVARYLWIEMASFGYSRLRARAAISLGAVFSGEMVKAGVIWWVRTRSNAGLPPDFIVLHQDKIILVGAAVLAIGGLCYIRIWSPRTWGEWPWIGTAFVAVLFATVGLLAALSAWIVLGGLFYFLRIRRKL